MSLRQTIMKRPVKPALAFLKAVGLVVVLGVAAHAGLPYLPLIGPPPLRMLVLKTPSVAAVKPEAPPVAKAEAPVIAATNLPVVAETRGLSGVTQAGNGHPAASAPVVSGPGAEQPMEAAANGPVFALPTPDLLGITPQMLATYFHPAQFGTNAIVLAAPYPISFLPPVPPAPADKSSRAEYIVK